jgi:hypothetical protein
MLAISVQCPGEDDGDYDEKYDERCHNQTTKT